MVPAGVAEDVKKLVAPAGSVPRVAEHFHPLVKGYADGIVGVEVLGEPELDGVGRVFGLERAEDLVPDNQRTAVVAVYVPGVGAVMDPVVRGRRGSRGGTSSS